MEEPEALDFQRFLKVRIGEIDGPSNSFQTKGAGIQFI
jgi:hypothetical protein